MLKPKFPFKTTNHTSRNLKRSTSKSVQTLHTNGALSYEIAQAYRNVLVDYALFVNDVTARRKQIFLMQDHNFNKPIDINVI